MTVSGTMRAIDEARGAIRVERVYDTDIDDLWGACTTPERLARWIAEVSGDLREGGRLSVMFTSAWTGPATIEVCEAPHHLLLTTGAEDESQVEAWLTVEGAQTRLVVEERGLPVGSLHFYGAGWEAHLEDLATALASEGPVHPDGWSADEPAAAWKARWEELTPAFEAAAVS